MPPTPQRNIATNQQAYPTPLPPPLGGGTTGRRPVIPPPGIRSAGGSTRPKGGNPPQGIRSAGGTLSGQPEGGSGPFRFPRKAAGACPPAGPAAQPSIEQPHDEIEAVTQVEEPGPSSPGGVRGALPKRLTPLAVGSRAQPWSLFGYFLANQKVTPRRAGGQGIYIFSYPPA